VCSSDLAKGRTHEAGAEAREIGRTENHDAEKGCAETEAATDSDEARYEEQGV